MLISKRIALFAGVAVATTVGFAAPASAQATRTWVSGVGDDVNPCSRTAPCKTFAGAISKTAAGGEINCLDPGGFGAVTIIKSMTISCPYTEGGALAGGNGITVNLPLATDVVFIRGLDIFGVNPPSHGVRFVGSGTLHIEDSVIRRFNATNSFGVSFQPSGAGQLIITNTTIAENGNGATGGGILVQPTGAGGGATVALRDVRVHNNANQGMRVETNGNTGPGITVSIDRAQFARNGTGFVVNVPAGTTSVGAMVVNSTIVNGTGVGIVANGGAAIVRVGNTTITGNSGGVTAGVGAVMSSYGDNRVDGNPTVGAANNGAFTPPIISKR